LLLIAIGDYSNRSKRARGHQERHRTQRDTQRERGGGTYRDVYTHRERQRLREREEREEREERRGEKKTYLISLSVLSSFFPKLTHSLSVYISTVCYKLSLSFRTHRKRQKTIKRERERAAERAEHRHIQRPFTVSFLLLSFR
jgi:hypothetical protein